MLGLLLKRLRLDERPEAKSVEAVAQALGIDRTAIHHIEAGRRRPSPEMLARLLRHYGASREEEDEAARLLVFPVADDPSVAA